MTPSWLHFAADHTRIILLYFVLALHVVLGVCDTDNHVRIVGIKTDDNVCDSRYLNRKKPKLTKRYTAVVAQL